MLKKLLGFVFIFFLTLVLAFVFFGKVIFAGALQSALGAPVKVGGLRVGLSEIGIDNLVIGSPRGFQEKKMAVIPEVSMQYDSKAVLGGKIHLKKIILRMAEATVEKSSGGKINLLELKPLKKSESETKETKVEPSQAPPKEKPASASPKASKPPFSVQIDEVLLDLGKVRYVDSGATPASVKEYSLGVRNESFRNVTNTPELIKQLAFFILKKVGLSSLTSNFDVLLKGLGGEVSSTVGKWMEKLR